MDKTLELLIYTGGAIIALYFLLRILEVIRAMLDRRHEANSSRDPGQERQSVHIAADSRVFHYLEATAETLKSLSDSTIMNVENTARLVRLGEASRASLDSIDASLIRNTDRQVTKENLADTERRLGDEIRTKRK
jgi:hypothetical protein